MTAISNVVGHAKEGPDSSSLSPSSLGSSSYRLPIHLIPDDTRNTADQDFPATDNVYVRTDGVTVIKQLFPRYLVDSESEDNAQSVSNSTFADNPGSTATRTNASAFPASKGSLGRVFDWLAGPTLSEGLGSDESFLSNTVMAVGFGDISAASDRSYKGKQAGETVEQSFISDASDHSRSDKANTFQESRVSDYTSSMISSGSMDSGYFTNGDQETSQRSREGQQVITDEFHLIDEESKSFDTIMVHYPDCERDKEGTAMLDHRDQSADRKRGSEQSIQSNGISTGSLPVDGNGGSSDLVVDILDCYCIPKDGFAEQHLHRNSVGSRETREDTTLSQVLTNAAEQSLADPGQSHSCKGQLLVRISS